MTRYIALLLASVPIALTAVGAAHAQGGATPPVVPTLSAKADQQVDFAADQLNYENDTDVVTATAEDVHITPLEG